METETASWKRMNLRKGSRDILLKQYRFNFDSVEEQLRESHCKYNNITHHFKRNVIFGYFSSQFQNGNGYEIMMCCRRRSIGVLKLDISKQTLVTKCSLYMETLGATIGAIAGILIITLSCKTFYDENIELSSVSAEIPSFYIVFAIIPLARN